nr:unnamed protein product [Callosobruchus analis]
MTFLAYIRTLKSAFLTSNCTKSVFLIATMRLSLIVLIALNMRPSSSQTGDDPIDCSVYRGLNITWKVKAPFSPRLSQDLLRFGVSARAYPTELPVHYHWDWGQPIPEEFDARQMWSNCGSIKEIRDQGHLTSASVMSDRICIHSNGKNQERISALDLLSCCEECSEGICETGWPSTAFKYWATTGIVTGGEEIRNQTASCRPYPAPIVPKEIECKTDCNMDSNLIYETDRRYGIYHKVEHVDRPEPRSGHAVKIIGWGVENETPYWLISDTHGESFGENGTFRILRGTDDCSIESWEVVAGLPR